MSRARTASKRKSSPEQKAQQENPPSSFKKNDSEKKPSSKSASGAFSYDSLAMQTLDLWREQLAHFLNNPDTMKDAKKGVEPTASLLSPQISQMFSPLFSGGMDLWLMMLEQLGKAANMNSPIGNTGAGSAGGNDQSKTRTAQTIQSGAAYRSENRSAAASALSGASTYAVAQLASRIADLEKRFAEFESDGKRTAKKPSAKKKTAAATLENIKSAIPKNATTKIPKRKR
ncbi:MAG: hypothetical protein SFW65_00985 [Alphaproteobacteria bacterium]|nr:hypothetical protein [Alphaproteobacteria bacterium]